MISDIKAYKPESKSISRSQILFEDYTKDKAIIPLLEMAYSICVDMCCNNLDAASMVFSIGYSKDYDGWYSKAISFSFRSRDYSKISKIIKYYYDREVVDLPIRRLMISLNSVLPIENRQLSLFSNENEECITLIEAIGNVWKSYGKNSILLGTSLCEGSTIKVRNKCIGGHNDE